MKFTLVLLIVAAVFGCVLSEEYTCTPASFDLYKLKFGKVYLTQEENIAHMDIFCKSLLSVEAHNKNYDLGLTTYKQAINMFSDLTKEEMSKYFGLRLP